MLPELVAVFPMSGAFPERRDSSLGRWVALGWSGCRDLQTAGCVSVERSHPKCLLSNDRRTHHPSENFRQVLMIGSNLS